MSREKKRQGKIFVISGPSGSGKTTLLEKVLKAKELKGKFGRSISLTTRPKRTGEVSGRHYFFVSNEDFRARLKAKKILEWTRYLGYYYATPGDFVEKQLKSGRNISLCLDLKGARHLKRIYPNNTVTIFIAPPSLGELKGRIEGRCKKTNKNEIRQRLLMARREVRASRHYDYTLLNEDLQQALKVLKHIILREISG